MMRQMNPESLKGMASLLQQYGRNGDTMLAHINPKEAMLLDRVSGGGSMNPMTGMPEFFDVGEAVGEAGSQGPSEEGDDDEAGGGMDGPEDTTFSDQDEVGEPGEQQTDIGTGVGEPGETGYGGDERGDPYGGQDPSLGPIGEDSADVMSRGLGSLASKVMPDKPGILEILTAPIETIVNALTLGLVDLELTGKDVTGVPGMTSSDLSRGAAGIPGPQPPGVEVGVPGIGTVGIGKDGVSTYGGVLTNTLTDLFSSGLKDTTASNLLSKDPGLANQLALDKMAVANKAVADKTAANVSPISNPFGDPITSRPTPDTTTPSTMPSFYSDQPTRSPGTKTDIDQDIIDMYNSLEGTLSAGPTLAPNQFATTKFAQGGPVSLDALYNNVRARRGPITGGQRSGGGIMSLR